MIFMARAKKIQNQNTQNQNQNTQLTQLLQNLNPETKKQLVNLLAQDLGITLVEEKPIELTINELKQKITILSDNAKLLSTTVNNGWTWWMVKDGDKLILGKANKTQKDGKEVLYTQLMRGVIPTKALQELIRKANNK